MTVLAQQYPDPQAKLTVSISPLLADDVREIGSALWILLGAVSVVFDWIDEVTLMIDQIQSSPAAYICSERSAEDNYLYSSIWLRLLYRFERLS